MKTTIVSAEQLRRYKKQLVFISLFFLAFANITLGMIIFDGKSFLLFNIPLLILLPFLLYREFKRLSTIAYDAHALYYGSASSPELHKVSFDNIRSIGFGKVDGVYKINFIAPVDGVETVYFKTISFYIPLSYYKLDTKVKGLGGAVNTHLGISDPDEQLQIYTVAAALPH
jgi:hypothetical protein